MSTDLKAIMQRDKRRRRMLNDPDLTGELLLFALALDEVIVTRQEQGRKTLRNWVTETSVVAHGENASTYYQRHWGKKVLNDDLPRYEPANKYTRACVAPMVRREGLCGKSGSVGLMDHDPVTGEAKYVHFCNRH
ncbi:hypothetical protein, partial [Streptomyces sp. NPDC055990]|uniref:hypothetical protein n=1 Tax=Streptomyces sp. NPDC055990 TaxID=3345672 RepID=UPI0035E0B117